VIRDLDEHLFDYLKVVIFDEYFAVSEMWKFPYSMVMDKSRYSKHVHGHIFYTRLSILEASAEVQRIGVQ